MDNSEQHSMRSYVTPDEHNSREDDSRRACLVAMGGIDKRCLLEEGHEGSHMRPTHLFGDYVLEAETHAGDERCPAMSRLSPGTRCNLSRDHDGQHEGTTALGPNSWVNHKHILDDTISGLPETEEEQKRFAELEQRFAVVIALHQGHIDDSELVNKLAKAVFHKPDPPPPTLGQVAHAASFAGGSTPWASVAPEIKAVWDEVADAVLKHDRESSTSDKPYRMIEVGELLSEVYAVLTDSDMLDMFRVQKAVILVKEAINKS